MLSDVIKSVAGVGFVQKNPILVKILDNAIEMGIREHKDSIAFVKDLKPGASVIVSSDLGDAVGTDVFSEEDIIKVSEAGKNANIQSHKRSIEVYEQARSRLHPSL